MTENKISFHDFIKILSYDVVKNYACIEINFYVDNCLDYTSCWLGKTIEKDTNTEVYWYGLAKDGSQAYDFYTIDDFINANVFCGESIKEIWDSISLYNIDSCGIGERLQFYLGQESQPIRRPAK